MTRFVVRGFIGEVTISCTFSKQEFALRAISEYLSENKCESVSVHVIGGEKND